MTAKLLAASRALSSISRMALKKAVFFVLFVAVVASIITTSLTIFAYKVIK